MPIDLNVPLATIGAIEVRQAGTTTRLSSVELGVRYTSRRWQVERVSAGTPWGSVRASLLLEAARPFALQGEVVLRQEQGEMPYRVAAAINGKLADIAVTSTYSVGDANNGITGSAAATLEPFNAQPLTRAEVKVPQLRLRNIDPALPDAVLNVVATLQPGAGDTVKGAISVINTSPGTLDQQRLPLVSATARFAGELKRVDLADVVLDLGAGGQFRGSGRYRNDGNAAGLERVMLALKTDNFNLNGMHAKLRKTAIKGEATIAPDKGGGRISATFRDARLALMFDARLDQEALKVARAELSAGNGRLAISGNMKLAGSREFQATGVLKKFNPADFGAYPAADLNADVSATGVAVTPWRAMLNATLTQSRFMGQPTLGRAVLTASADAVRDVDVALVLGNNQFAARGGLGRGTGAEARIDWKLDAPQLSQLHRDFSGSLSAKGSASGVLAAPLVDIDAEGKDLRLFAGHRIKVLSGRAQIALNTKTDAALSVDLIVGDYVSPRFSITRATAKLDGTRASHSLALNAINADFNVRLDARGALDAANRWRGEIRRLDNRGSVPFSLLAAAPLAASADGRVELGLASFDVGGGKLEISQFVMGSGAVSTRGNASGLPLAVAVPFSEALKRNIDTNLKLGAQWNIATSRRTAASGLTPITMSGTLRLFRESGDIRFLSEPPFTAGLEALDIKADIADNQVSVSLATMGRELGRIDLAASTRAERRGEVGGIPAGAPLQLNGEIDVPSLLWVSRVAGQPGVTFDGRLHMKVLGAGTFGSPQLSGRATGSGLALAWPEQGINYKQGTLEAEFRDDTLSVARLTFAAGEGRLEAKGRLAISGIKSSGKLTVALDRFEAVSRPDRQVVASGEGSLDLDENRISINAKLKSERGFFELPEKSDITLSDDIFIVGKAVPAERKENKMTTKVELNVDLGDNFRIRGAGLNGRLEGTLRVASAGAGLPRAVGTLRIEDGTYAVYGQKLAVERGVLTFAGPIHNPGIDLYALRKNPQTSVAGNGVEAGVEVRGSALSPRAKLVSTPNVPETEKLAWLVLGRGLESSSQADFSLLSTAANGLLGGSQAAAIQARIAGALGVDEFGISPPGGGQGGLLTVGKRISSRLFVAYEQGLGKVSNILKVRYTLSKRWSVQAQAGTESAVDALFTLSFD